MSRDYSFQGPAEARPVADAPIEALVERADELSRSWLVSLLAARALSQMADVPVEQLARDAPALCARLVRALGSDADLEPLLQPRATTQLAAAPGDGELATWLVPLADAATLVADVDALRNVIWQAALGELREPSVRQVTDLADRLAYICALLLAAALRRSPAQPAAAAAGLGDSRPAPVAERVLYRSPRVSAGGRQAVLIDEINEIDERAAVAARDRSVASERPDDRAARARQDRPLGDRPTVPAGRTTTGASPAHTSPRARPWDIPLNRRDGASAGHSSGVAEPPTAPDDSAGVMRITRGPGSRVDDRA